MRFPVKSAAVLSLAATLLWAGNTSLNAPGGVTRLLAHRGVHQTFPLNSVDNDTCTAAIIDPPRHAFIENTIPSMRAAFAAGADVVELDVHLTPDNQFAVFHDWTLDCRTNGSGVTEQTQMAALRILDAGFGYTSDGGKTFPLRGKGAGLIATLPEIFNALPGKRFLINFKSRRIEEGEALAALLKSDPAARDAAFGVYGGREPTRAAMAHGLPGYDKASLVACGWRYLLTGWSGYVPHACRGQLLAVPVNFAPLLWGWPHRLASRLKAQGTAVILLGPYGGGGFSSGIDTPELLARVPANFDGYVWTNRIETIGPLLKNR